MKNQNIQFNYLYRDASNFKRYGHVIFSNPRNFSIDKLERRLTKLLIDNEYFYHWHFGVPCLYFENQTSRDHNHHKYESLEATDCAPTDNRTIDDLIFALNQTVGKKTGNDFSAIEVSYLHTSKTIETILLNKRNTSSILYVYNHEGSHFRVFDDVINLINFFDGLYNPEIEFDNEDELDLYLANYNLAK